MQYGICNLSITPVRSSPNEISEMITQLLFGEHFKILESRKNWSRVKTIYDKCEGWIMNNQLTFIPEEEFSLLEQNQKPKYATELVTFIE